MPPSFPYAFYVCPCTEADSTFASDGVEASEDTNERTLNPHDPRTAYTLYTLEHLLFCDDCNQIRCPRCVSEEIINYYCPNCLFEVPSSGVKSDGNRCSRNCYSCPSCTAPLIINQLDTQDDQQEQEAGSETYILSCHHCEWSSLDIGVKLNRPTKITDQLNQIYRDRHSSPTSAQDTTVKDQEQAQLSFQERYDKITAFYKEQLVSTGETSNSRGYGSYNSPANLARIINIYGGLTHNALKKTQEKPRPMHEAGHEEGLLTYNIHDSGDDGLVQKLSEPGWTKSVAQTQRLSGPTNFDAQTTDDLWPIAVHLRTKRGKRCRTCRQFVVRPDTKLTSTKAKVRIIAINHIPRLSIKPLDAPKTIQNPSFILRHDQVQEQPLLQPHITKQYVLTLRNPIFETVKVTLATSATTPGRVASKVTILCPSFSIGPAGDVWDDALGGTPSSGHSDGSRKAAMASLVGSNEADRQPEAGKVWEQTRNSTSVVVEIVPGALSAPPKVVPDADHAEPLEELEEGDDVLEVPIYVRVEWLGEAALEGEQKSSEKVPRELAYWCVLGIGRIAV